MSYRYIGNKTRLLDQLVTEIKSILPNGGTVADVMCGTASVAEALRVNDFSVIASDLMTYSAHHARVRLLMNAAPKFNALGLTYKDVLETLNSAPPVKGHFYREYSPEGSPLNGEAARKYVSADNAMKIDGINQQISLWKEENRLSYLEHSLLRHNFVLAVNKVANIAGTYGHFRAKLGKSALTSLELKPSEFLNGYSTQHTVLQGPAEVVACDITADLCYIDPPYMKRQYAANYHLIETIARGDHPEAVGVSGLRPWRDQYSNFCSKVKIRDSFRQIFSHMNCPKFLISYSEDGLLSKEELTELFQEFGSVTFKEIMHQRFKSNQGGQGGNVTEFLFLLEKKP